MTTQPDIRTDSDLAQFIVATRAKIYAQYDEELRRAAEVLENAKSIHDAAKAAYRKIEDESTRRRAAETSQLLDAIVEAAQRLLTSAEPAVVVAAPPPESPSVPPPAEPTAKPRPVATDEEHGVAPSVSAKPGQPPAGTVVGGAAADPVVAAEIEHLVGPTLASDPGVRPPRVGDKVRLHAGGIGEISDAMMGIASIKDGPTLKYTVLIQAAPGSEVQWTEKLLPSSATTTATALPEVPGAVPKATDALPEATTATATTTATDGKERRKCERCGTEALVLQSGQLRGHLTPDKKRCAPEGELAHEIPPKSKREEPPTDEWPSSKTASDSLAKSLF